MSDGLAFVAMIVGFALVIVAGAKLGAGSHTALAGMFATQGARDWPTGVQEADAPRFDFAGPSAPLTPASPAGDLAVDALPVPEIEDLYVGPIRSVHRP